MKGSTFKRCGCREELPDGEPGKGKPLGDKCPALGKSSHGSWFYRADIGPDPLTGKRREQRKGGFRTAKQAQAAGFGPLYEFLAFTGLRRGDACALRWSDVVLEDRVFNLETERLKARGSSLADRAERACALRRAIRFE